MFILLCFSDSGFAVFQPEPDFIDVDKADGDSPLLVAHYAFEIYQYLQSLEVSSFVYIGAWLKWFRK